MESQKRGRIRIGIGGWSFPPWRGAFYPDGLPQKRELEYASRRLTTIEINSTYYGAQKPESFSRWHDETPDDFVFSVKAPRFATTRRDLAGAGPTIERFLGGGVLELKGKLGPISWQFMPGKAFDPTDFEAFLRLLPCSAGGLPLRHAVEVRHDSFRNPEFIAMARDHGVAIVTAADSQYPQIADPTAPFVYVRIMGTQAEEPLGYPEAALDLRSDRAVTWAAGQVPHGLDGVARAEVGGGRDVFIYVISGDKHRNPAAAAALIDRIG